MKRIITYIALLTFGIAIFLLSYDPGIAYAGKQPCYICNGGKYICYSGSDTKKKRNIAKSKYNCVITGTSSCSAHDCKGKNVK